MSEATGSTEVKKNKGGRKGGRLFPRINLNKLQITLKNLSERHIPERNQQALYCLVSLELKQTLEKLKPLP